MHRQETRLPYRRMAGLTTSLFVFLAGCRRGGSTLLIFWLVCVAASSTLAQRAERADRPANRVFPFADPQEFFQQLFGAGGAEDRAEISKIAISVREEKQIGARGVNAYLASLRRRKINVVPRGKDIDYLQQLIATLRPHMKNNARYRKIRVYLADSPKTDARSFPGGALVVFQGMLDFVENEAALAGVIGHELSHLDRGHQLYDAKRMKLAQETFSGANGFSPERFFSSGAMLMRSFMRPFRPEEESEADDDGVRWVYDAGYDPREMAKVFLRMHRRDDDGKDVPAFLRSHPYHIDRYQAAIDRYERLQETDPREELYIGRENLRRRVPRSKTEFDE